MSTDKLKRIAQRLTGSIGDRKAAVGGQKPRGRLTTDDQSQLAARLDTVDPRGRRTVLDELAILRQTRGQRDVGTVVIPPELRVAQPMDDRGVEARGMAAAVLPAKE